MKKIAFISYRGESYRIAWYQGTSDNALRDTIKETLSIPPDAYIVLKDENDIIYAINQHLPDNIHLVAEKRSSDNSRLIGDEQNKLSKSSGDVAANTFRGELLKFERINAHLANERTWLAWVRTALSTLSCAFAFLSLSRSSTYDVVVYVLGSVFCLSVLFVYYTGWLRYSKIKLILGLSFSEMSNKFDRVGIHWIAKLLGILFVATCIIYWIGVFTAVK